MLKLITDRKSSDVTRAKKLVEKAKNIESLTPDELQEYLSGLKGCYNISDLNRVEQAVQYLSNLLNSLDYYNTVETKSWEPGQLFTIDKELPRYLQNIKNIRSAIPVPSSISQVPNSIKPFDKANTIEKILVDLEYLLENLKNNFVHAGVANSGQSRTWQQRFRRQVAFTVKRWSSLTEKYWNNFTENQTWNDIMFNEKEG